MAPGTGSVEYLKEDGHTIAQNRAAWLWKFHDGRLLRVASFPSEDEALSAYDAVSDDFVLPEVAV